MGLAIELWEHQKRAIEKARNRSGFALLMEMGTGKTATAIHILNNLIKKETWMLRTLILCPQIVIQNWAREFPMHSDLKSRDIIPLIGTGAKRAATFIENAFTKHGAKAAKIFITNYETLLIEKVFEQIVSWKPEVLICDESHKLKDPQTKRSKAARIIGDGATYKLIMTGTPVLNTMMDLFSQFRVMDGGEAFGKNFFAFRNTYFYDQNAFMPKNKYFPNWKLKPEAIPLIREKMEPVSFTAKKGDCLDLPPLVRQTIYVELGAEQKKHYEAMKKDFITYCGSKACVANLAITKALRLQQILSGFLSVETDGKNELVYLKDNPRALAAKELITDLAPHSKILVWAVFKADFELLKKTCDEAKAPYVEIHGEVSAKQKQIHVDDFNTNPKTRVFIGHPGSGGIGVNLTVAPYSLFYSRNFSLEQDLQAEARNHRGGSEIHEKITRIDLVAAGTMDELILSKLKNKMAMGESVVREMAKELANGI